MDQSGGQLPGAEAGRGSTSRVLIASNRGPVSFAVGEDGSLVAQRGAGGLVSGLSSIRDQADVLWVCAALSDADRAAARSVPDGRIDAELTPGKSVVRMLDIPAPTFQRAYNSVANSTLWFLHHMLYDTPNQPRFGLAFRREWESFRAYNAAFADALAEGAPAAGARDRSGRWSRTITCHWSRGCSPSGGPTSGSRISRTRRGRLPTTTGCCRTRWAGRCSTESSARITPASCCQRWADAFLDCCAEFLDSAVDPAAGTVRYKGKLTSVAVHPLGVRRE